jgi:hypothetical protein
LAEKAERLGCRLKLRVLLRSFDAVCRFVECDVGVGVVPATTALRLSRAMAIRRVDLTGLGRARAEDLSAARRNETEVGDSPVLPDAAPQSARLR